MGTKQSKDAHGASGKKDCLLFDPKDLVIVEDVGSALHDDRAKLPVSESLVLNIMVHGVLEPILVRKNTDTGKTEVVAGRQRVKACIEANRRLKKQGAEEHRIPALVKRGEPHALMGMMISENAIREDETPIGRAKKMSRYMDLGRTEEECSVQFGCSVATVKNSIALLDAPKAVRKAVETGRVTASDGYKLSKLDAAEAEKRLAQLEKEAPTQPGRKRRANGTAAKKIVNGNGGAMTVKEIKGLLEKLQGEETEKMKEMHRAGAQAALQAVLGEKGPLETLMT